MKTSEKGVKDIKLWEQLRLYAYKAVATEKYYTIGYGHYSPVIKKNQRISLEKAEEYLKEDLRVIEELLSDYCPNLRQYEFDALVSLIFNIGWYRFRQSMVGVKAHDYSCGQATAEDVASRMILYVYSGNVKVSGLINRRVYEANNFLDCAYYKREGNTILKY